MKVSFLKCRERYFSSIKIGLNFTHFWPTKWSLLWLTPRFFPQIYLWWVKVGNPFVIQKWVKISPILIWYKYTYNRSCFYSFKVYCCRRIGRRGGYLISCCRLAGNCYMTVDNPKMFSPLTGTTRHDTWNESETHLVRTATSSRPDSPPHLTGFVFGFDVLTVATVKLCVCDLIYVPS